MSTFTHNVENDDAMYPEDATHIFTYDVVTSEGHSLRLKFECNPLDISGCRELTNAMVENRDYAYVLSSYNGDVTISTQNGFCEFVSERMHDDTYTSCAFRVPNHLCLPIFLQLAA